MVRLFLSILVFLVLSSNFLNAKPPKYETCIYSLSMPEPPLGGESAFINGINHKPERALKCAKILSRAAGDYNIYTVYNPTRGLFADLNQCYHELFKGKITPPVRKLQEKWNTFFEGSQPDDIYLQFCHSQGCIQVRNALHHYSPFLRKRIMVVAIAPAAYIPPHLCYRAYHYVSRRDIVPHLDSEGKKYAGESIVVLNPHRDAAFFDHHFLSPTYRNAISYHLQSYLLNPKAEKVTQ